MNHLFRCRWLGPLLLAVAGIAAADASAVETRPAKAAGLARGCLPLSPAEARAAVRHARPGESAMPLAPRLRIADRELVPSQYKLFRHTERTVQAVVAKLRYKPNFVLLVGGGSAREGVYVQVGLIGPDNYPAPVPGAPNKIVYGRKWRVEKELPTSELIQTVYLAIKNAEEHELRERFVVAGTTPFNGHSDLPLLAAHMATRASPTVEPTLRTQADVERALVEVDVGGCILSVHDVVARGSGHLIFDVRFQADAAERGMPELSGKTITVVAEQATQSGVLRGLFTAALREVHREVDERFHYDGFARFSHQIPVAELVDFVRWHRAAPEQDMHPDFPAVAQALNRAIDATRPAALAPGRANDRARATIAAQGPALAGILPPTAAR